jgi:hypothetical protein
MGKKVGKPRKVPPDQSDPAPQAARLGSATSGLPQPLQPAVDATSKVGGARSLREELAVAIFTLGYSDPSEAPTGPLRPGVGLSSNRPKTSRPVAEILMQKAGLIEAALEIHKSTASESLKADAAQWIRVVVEHIEDPGRHQPLIYVVSVLSQPQMVVRGLEWYAPFLPDFWRWYAAHTEFACELIAAIVRWNSCRGGSNEERIKKFLIPRPGIPIDGQVFIVHSGIFSGEAPLPPTATDQQICEAFREFTGQDVSPKLVGNARQRWFGNDQRYRADLVRRVALFLK